MVKPSQRAPIEARPGMSRATAPVASTTPVATRNHWPRPICSNKSTIKGTPASLAKPAARKAAARIPCNVQAPMRRVGRTDWMEVALILDSVACEVESDERLGCRPPWQKPIYSDDIHRPCRYVVDTGPLVRWMFSARLIGRSVGGAVSQRAHASSDVIRFRWSRWFVEP